MKFIPYVLAFLLYCFSDPLNAQCIAAFDYTPTGTHSFEFVSLIPGATSTKWFFDGGDTSVISNPSYIFADTGSFMVCLHAEYPGNCSADTCISIRVDTCQAYFTYVYDPTLLQPEQAVYFFYDSSYGEQPGTTYLWHFGTGDYSTQKDQALVYETDDAGPEEVCLTITTPGNTCTSTYCHTIIVDALCGADTFAYTVHGRIVNFTSWICGYWNTINWDFGDGGTATQSDVAIHNYTSSADSFYVCLTVSFDSVCRDGVPCTAIYCQQINLSATPVENLNPSVPEISVLVNTSGNEATVSLAHNNSFLKLELFNGEGRLLHTRNIGTQSIALDLSEFATGLYFVVASNSVGQKSVTRFIKP